MLVQWMHQNLNICVFDLPHFTHKSNSQLNIKSKRNLFTNKVNQLCYRNPGILIFFLSVFFFSFFIFFCMHVLLRFSKVGSPEISWLESGMNFRLNLCLRSWSLAKISKYWAWKFKFFQKIEVESPELEKGLKWCFPRAKKWSELGGLEGSTSPYYLPIWVHICQLSRF